jgi:predicted Fe-Mo cluster-binding NifX family protein
LSVKAGSDILTKRKGVDWMDGKEAKNMKVGVPSLRPGGLDADVSAHFGHCEVFTAVELDGREIKKVWTLDNDDGEHNCMIPVQRMAKEGIDTVLIGGIGRRPLAEFQRMGVSVYVGAAGSVRDALTGFLSGSLREATLKDVCRGGCH